jgi:hypothetical protein
MGVQYFQVFPLGNRSLTGSIASGNLRLLLNFRSLCMFDLQIQAYRYDKAVYNRVLLYRCCVLACVGSEGKRRRWGTPIMVLHTRMQHRAYGNPTRVQVFPLGNRSLTGSIASGNLRLLLNYFAQGKDTLRYPEVFPPVYIYIYSSIYKHTYI